MCFDVRSSDNFFILSMVSLKMDLVMISSEVYPEIIRGRKCSVRTGSSIFQTLAFLVVMKDLNYSTELTICFHPYLWTEKLWSLVFN